MSSYLRGVGSAASWVEIQLVVPGAAGWPVAYVMAELCGCVYVMAADVVEAGVPGDLPRRHVQIQAPVVSVPQFFISDAFSFHGTARTLPK